MTDKSKSIQPIQLISFQSGKSNIHLHLGLKVNRESIALLESLNDSCRNLAIITVVGKYRTGKSYILNRVLLQQNSGFEVGPTINACTKGLWIWPKPIKIGQGEDAIHALIMDTEGLGSLEEGENADIKVFLMALLLSSYFIYNSMGSIDEKTVQSLSLIVNLSKLLQKGKSTDVQDIINCFPNFLWLVRDFALRLEDEKGRPIKPSEYLQNALKLQTGKSEMVQRKNSVRRQLTNFFKQRDCFVLIRPIADQDKLQKLATLKDQQLRPEFLNLVKELRTKIFSQVKRKMFKGRACSPLMFIQMCQYFCDAINKGDLPEISSNWDLVCQAQAQRIYNYCENNFNTLLLKFQKMHSHELNLETFEKQCQNTMNNLLKYLEKNVLGDKDKYKKELKKKFKYRYNQLKQNIQKDKNRELESQFYVLNQQINQKIIGNKILNIFQISQAYDSMIEQHSKNANSITLSIVHKKAYQGIKAMAINFLSSVTQTQKLQSNILTQKVNLYQKSYNTLQAQYSSCKTQNQDRQRQLRSRLFMLEFKAKQTNEELERTKELLQGYNRVEKKKNVMICKKIVKQLQKQFILQF